MIEKQRLIAKHRQEDLWAGMLLQSSEKNTDSFVGDSVSRTSLGIKRKKKEHPIASGAKQSSECGFI